MQFLFGNYTSVKLERKKNIKKQIKTRQYYLIIMYTN
jgi:hypothetical protein